MRSYNTSATLALLALTLLTACNGAVSPAPGAGRNNQPAPVEFDWRPFLEGYSRDLLADNDIRNEVPEAVRQSGWMGFDGATEGQIEALEGRLGKRLPPSYRDFLLTSNGWRQTGPFIYRMHAVEEVDWFRQRHRDWIRAYAMVPGSIFGPSVPDAEYFVYGAGQDPALGRWEYLQDAIEISDVGDAAIYLLNPQVVTADGEWEAWFFANWLPGAVRYPSFREMMLAERDSLASFKK